MKRLLCFVFLFSFLMANTELHELWKLPVLIHHFHEHKQEDNQVSFTDFLELHYSSLSKHHAEKHHHERLPFKTEAGLHQTIASHDFELIDLSSASISYHDGSGRIYTSSPYSHQASSGIWQPPRFIF